MRSEDSHRYGKSSSIARPALEFVVKFRIHKIPFFRISIVHLNSTEVDAVVIHKSGDEFHPRVSRYPVRIARIQNEAAIQQGCGVLQQLTRSFELAWVVLRTR